MPNAQALAGTGKPERKPSLVESAYEALKQAICDGVFPPGHQGSEQEMAQHLGMSRTPVHQAIIRLQNEGMVELRPKRGVVISALSASDMKEVYDVMIAVEGMAAMLVAELPPAMREEACRRLDELNGEVAHVTEADDLYGWADSDAEFHAAMVHAAGNSRLERISKLTIDQSFRARRLTLHLRPRPVHSFEEHRLVVEAIRAGMPESARDMAQIHKIRARDLIVDLLKRYNMRHL